MAMLEIAACRLTDRAVLAKRSGGGLRPPHLPGGGSEGGSAPLRLEYHSIGRRPVFPT